MSSNNSSSTSSGVGVTGLLGVSFVVLKLINVINWSWWWVTAPFWVPIVLGIAFIILYFILKYISK